MKISRDGVSDCKHETNRTHTRRIDRFSVLNGTFQLQIVCKLCSLFQNLFMNSLCCERYHHAWFSALNMYHRRIPH
jgi:hypothetical protein